MNAWEKEAAAAEGELLRLKTNGGTPMQLALTAADAAGRIARQCLDAAKIGEADESHVAETAESLGSLRSTLAKLVPDWFPPPSVQQEFAASEAVLFEAEREAHVRAMRDRCISMTLAETAPRTRMAVALALAALIEQEHPGRVSASEAAERVRRIGGKP